jgi:hypothetical protein
MENNRIALGLMTPGEQQELLDCERLEVYEGPGKWSLVPRWCQLQHDKVYRPAVMVTLKGHISVDTARFSFSGHQSDNAAITFRVDEGQVDFDSIELKRIPT